MTSLSFDERVEQRVKATRVAIDDYNDTIHAIIGFVNLYLLDNKYQLRPDIKAFQGRRMVPLGTTEPDENNDDAYITPDLGILLSDESGILGEVKKNIPKDDPDRAEKAFSQLKKYDQQLLGWPIEGEIIDSHELVLLVHIGSSTYAREYLEKLRESKKIEYQFPISIVEFGRVPQAEEQFFLRTVMGNPPEHEGPQTLRYGVYVPTRVFLSEYAKIKLYDAQPPIPYLAEMLWGHVFTPIATGNPKFEGLRKNQKIEIELSLEEIIETVNESFSFRLWHLSHPNRQPKIPRRTWVEETCQFLVDIGEAEWFVLNNVKKIRIQYRRIESVLEYFTQQYADREERRLSSPKFPGFEVQAG
jgi:hypothetical protein